MPRISTRKPRQQGATLPQRSIASQASAKDVSDRAFKDLPISLSSRNSIKHEYMTQVQAQTLENALTGDNLLVQARTGTGKTLAFLLPAIETISKIPNRKGVSVLILAPTRELALQIEAEGKPLIAGHGMKIATAFGGVARGPQIKAITSGCDVLVATPGRLYDLLSNFNETRSHFFNLKVYILDEVDRLLDIGFKRELDNIQALLPDPTRVPRQSLFFSATIDQKIKQTVDGLLKKNYKFVSTVTGEEELTHDHVEQSRIIAPFSDHMPTLLHLLQHDKAAHGAKSKVMVFFPTARQVGFATETCRKLSIDAIEIHSKLSQPARNKNAQKFREASGGLLLSSDVAARGVDFPGVTLVVQLGLPANGEQYVHRLGRTARAGAAGRGVLVLDATESRFLNDRALGNVPIAIMEALSQEALQVYLPKLLAAYGQVDRKIKARTYMAWLGYYNGANKVTGWNKHQLVQSADSFARKCLGWVEQEPPAITTRAAGMMNLKGVPGVKVVKFIEDE